MFLRELYVEGIKTYSTQQAQGLIEAYRLVFEGDGSEFQKQLDAADKLVMKPPTDHWGILDEVTQKRIYDVHNQLETFRGQPWHEVRLQKNKFLGVTITAGQFVKADKIAFRLGLISHPLKERSADK